MKPTSLRSHADAVGVSKSTIANWENRRQEIMRRYPAEYAAAHTNGKYQELVKKVKAEIRAEKMATENAEHPLTAKLNTFVDALMDLHTNADYDDLNLAVRTAADASPLINDALRRLTEALLNNDLHG